MTDEDDRMDRAKRIREMREGNRDGDDAGDEPSDASDAGETEQNQPENASDDDGQPEDNKQTMEDLVTEAAEEAAAGDTGGEESRERDDEAGTGDGGADDETAEPAETADTTEGQPVDDGSDTETDAQDRDQPAETGEGDDVAAPLPDTDTLEAALDDGEEVDEADGDDEPTPAPGAAEVVEAEESTTEEETRVLEFTLDDEHYCLDIEYIEEIVKEETITRVPNTPEYVAGVVDLRGQITTILNPKVTLGKENTEADELIVVFDSEAFEDQGHLGWVVDDVRQVSPIVESEVNDPPMEADYINGVIDRGDDEEFVIWTSPDLALEEAE
jgi:purine-binding chemotaxis protein CheW